jgi:hypothetical protein
MDHIANFASAMEGLLKPNNPNEAHNIEKVRAWASADSAIYARGYGIKLPIYDNDAFKDMNSLEASLKRDIPKWISAMKSSKSFNEDMAKAPIGAEIKRKFTCKLELAHEKHKYGNIDMCTVQTLSSPISDWSVGCDLIYGYLSDLKYMVAHAYGEFTDACNDYDCNIYYDEKEKLDIPLGSVYFGLYI